MFYTMFDQDIPFSMSLNESLIGFKLSKYYAYCRDNLTLNLHYFYVVWVFWVFLSSYIMYVIPQEAYKYGVE